MAGRPRARELFPFPHPLRIDAPAAETQQPGETNVSAHRNPDPPQRGAQLAVAAPDLRRVTVLLGDPRLPDTTKHNHRFSAEDMDVRARMEAALGEALTRLSGLTRAAAVVLTAKSNSRLKHIEFVRLEPERALVVLVGEDGQVENRVLTLPPGVPSSALIEATNFLNARIRGRTLAEARLELETSLTQNRAELDQLGAEGAHRLQLLLGESVRTDDTYRVPLDRTDERQRTTS